MADLLLIFAVAVCILNYMLLWLFYRKFKSDYERFAKRIQEIGLENELSNVFAPNSSHTDILRITNELFARINKAYGIQAHSYTDLVNHLRNNSDIDINLRNMMIDYFDTVTLISYRDHNVTETERAEIKSKLKLLIKMLPGEVGLSSVIKGEK